MASSVGLLSVAILTVVLLVPAQSYSEETRPSSLPLHAPIVQLGPVQDPHLEESKEGEESVLRGCQGSGMKPWWHG